MTHFSAARPPLAPCSPPTGGRPPGIVLAPPPLSSGGGEHEGRPKHHHTTTPLAPHEKGRAQPQFNPGNVWLITPRTHPAWTAALHLLDDGHWHPTTDVAQVMSAAADLAPRTIANHLRSAGKRRWITTGRGGRIRLRDRHLLEAALDALSQDTQQ